MPTPTATFHQGQELSRGDLDIFLLDGDNNRVTPAEIFFAVFDFTTGTEILIGSPTRDPANPEKGEYYAPLRIPEEAPIGVYRIRWFFRETVNGPQHIVVQEFEVREPTAGRGYHSPYSEKVQKLIRSMRIMLRDNNPDRNYRLRPPVGEGAVNAQTRVFGYIWEDYELVEYLERGVDQVNLTPPLKNFTLETVPDAYRTIVVIAAMANAVRALTLNWIESEFGYSIGGVSLDLERSSKYQSMMESLVQQFDQQIERANATIKITSGLRQSRYGIGIRSSFGPHVGSGVLSPRSFVRF